MFTVRIPVTCWTESTLALCVHCRHRFPDIDIIYFGSTMKRELETERRDPCAVSEYRAQGRASAAIRNWRYARNSFSNTRILFTAAES